MGKKKYAIVKSPSWREVSASLFGVFNPSGEHPGGRHIVEFEVPAVRKHCMGVTSSFLLAIDEVKRSQTHDNALEFVGTFPGRSIRFSGFFYPLRRRGGWIFVNAKEE